MRGKLCRWRGGVEPAGCSGIVQEIRTRLVCTYVHTCVEFGDNMKRLQQTDWQAVSEGEVGCRTLYFYLADRGMSFFEGRSLDGLMTA